MINMKVVIVLLSACYVANVFSQKTMEKPYKQTASSELFASFLERDGKIIVKQQFTGDENTDDAICTGSFVNNVKVTGWAQLDIATNSMLNNSMQAYAAGYTEGVITRDMISDRWENAFKDFCQPRTEYCNNLHTFLETNMKYMLSKINSNPYWEQIYYILLQLQGLEDGYHAKTVDLSIRLSPFGLLLLNVDGDLEDLQTALNDPSSERILGSGSCSALIKILAGYKDIYVAHDTWDVYTSMLRIIKKYTLNFKDASGNLLPGHTSSFSSEPGRLYSGDDFYILSSGLVAMETTIGNSNNDLWKYVTPENSVLEGFRNMVANRMATTGLEWCKVFAQLNSGTYNNQWMIVDYNKFKAGTKPSNNGLLYVLEQIPGTIEYKDVTDVLLKQNYWASYNSPYFKAIFDLSGLPAMVKKFGDWFTHDKTPRALIFARNQSSVNDVDGMIKLMRYNNFKHDPLSAYNCTPPYSAENTIAARSDLNPKDGDYPFAALGFRNHGATDVKMTTSEMRRSGKNAFVYRNFELVAESGPTHDQQPVFVWSRSPFANLSHRGMPDRYDFVPTLVTWEKHY